MADLGPVSFREAMRVWLYVGLNSFGGPAGQIAVMHRVVVVERRWIGEARFLHALNYCMLLPGPEAMQLATYIGWLMHGTPGGLVAGTLFVLPGFLAVLGLSAAYATWSHLPFMSTVFAGIKPAVLAIIVEAVLRVGGRALPNRFSVAIAAATFVSMCCFDVPFPWIVLSAGVVGFVMQRVRPAGFAVLAHASSPARADDARETVLSEDVPAHARPTPGRTVRVAAIGAGLWLAPFLGIALAFGQESVFWDQAVFFSKAAMVTFGGAYAVLAYVAQQAVDVYAWLRPAEMVDGLGLAETTPGPLILVLEFVGFMGARRHPAGLDPMTAGVLGALVTVWVTFVPCFLWIFLGAPYVEALRRNARLNAVLAGITAAVVGVVGYLALWFALHTLFESVSEVRSHGVRIWIPALDTLRVVPCAITLVALIAVLRFKVGVLWTILGCVLLSIGAVRVL